MQPPEDELQALANEAIARAFAAGFGIVPSTRESGHLVHTPFSLLPRKARQR
jgi:hypothetical protein